MTPCAVEKELLQQTFQYFTLTTVVTESLKASDRCRWQPILKRDVKDLTKRHCFSVTTVYHCEDFQKKNNNNNKNPIRTYAE